MKVKKWYLVVIMAVIATVCTALLAACNNEEEPTSDGSENGIYYYDATPEEYTLNLNSNSFMFYVDGDNKFGSYTIKDNALTFTFVNETESGMSGALEDDTLKVTYNNAEMTFLKKVNYTLSFESNGGSAVGNKSVVNGKSADKPADPVKDGYVFIGWYADAEFKTLYDFGAVKSDVKVYAQWAEVIPGKTEFTVNYDLGYEAEAPASQTTIGGKLYNVPAPERSGYTFGGWWVSQYGDGSKLSYAYAEGMEIKENLTLYAVWKASGSKAPAVSIDGNNIKWNSEAGTSYKLEVTGPEGFVAINEDVPTAIKAVFANAPAGDYEITVTATSGGKSESTKLYYKLNALDRVSAFSVSETSVLFYNAVEHAEKYLITVECGNEEHNHVLFDNGTSTNFNFANCAMKAGGIKFTVTAIADGYASSVSESYIYNRELNKVTGLKIDEATQSIVWDSVAGATNYVVTVKQGEATKTIDNGDKTSISLKAYGKGEITVSVAPKTNGYNSPEASEIKFDKKTLAAPDGIKLNGTVLEWNAVDGAAGYEVLIGGKSVSVSEGTSTDLASLSFTDGNYTVTILAKGASAAENSVWSDGIDVSFNANITGLVYSQNAVSWNHVIGAVKYEVKVNGNVVKVIEDGANSAEVVLTKQGVNVIEVRYSNETAYSEWVKTEVYAHAVTFDTRSSYGEYTQYVAVGDKLNPPEAEKAGYELNAWYNSPSNGSVYDKEIFDGAGDIVLYAGWKVKSFKVTFDASDATDSVLFNSDYKLFVPVSEDGLVFGGWYSESGVQFTNDKGESLSAWSATEDTKLYAKWLSDVLSYYLLESSNTYTVRKGADIGLVTTLVVPSEYNGKAVTGIDGFAFQGCAKLTSISIPDTVTVVEKTAFNNCSNLKEVNVYHVDGNNEVVFSSDGGVLIFKNETANTTDLYYFPAAKSGEYTVPAGITSIPLNLFANSKLTEITIPKSVTKIEQGAFDGCRQLKKVTFEAGAGDELTIAKEAFNNCTSLMTVTLPERFNNFNMTSFNGCTSLMSIYVDASNENYSSANGILCDKSGETVIYCPKGREGVFVVPVGVKTIGESAFANCIKLTEVYVSATVTTIDKNAFSGCSSLEKLTLAAGSNPLTLNEGVFANCASLTEISIPARLTEFTPKLFAGCFGLNKILIDKDHASYADIDGVVFDKDLTTLVYYPRGREGAYVVPDSTTKIGDDSFSEKLRIKGKDPIYGWDTEYDYQRTNLTSVTIPASVTEIGTFAFYNCINLETITFTGASELVKIGESAFGECQSLKGFVIPANVTEIGEAAFATCLSLTEIVIPAGVTVLSEDVFFSCAKLVTVTFAEGSKLVEIGDYAFGTTNANRAVSFTSIELPETVEKIGEGAFRMSKLASINIPDGVKEIGDLAFANTAITKIELPAGIEELGPTAFSNCSVLTGVYVADGNEKYYDDDGVLFGKGEREEYGVKELIPYTAMFFYPLNGKEKYTVADDVTEIRSGIFDGNKKLTSISFGSGLATIYFNAFRNCSNLESISFKNGTSKLGIGFNAFEGCVKLTSVVFPDNMYNIGDYVFMNCTGLEEVSIPGTFTSFEDHSFDGCSKLTKITVRDAENAKFTQSGDLVLKHEKVKDEDVVTVVQFPVGLSGKVVIPEGVTAIGARAFYGCTKITEVEIPASVTSIGTYAFYGCINLEKVTFAEGSKLTTIGSNAFSSAMFNSSAYYGSKLKSITIPKSVTTIGSSAFAYSAIESVTFEKGINLKVIDGTVFSTCKLTTIEIPASVTTLGNGSIRDCKELTSITFEEGNKLTTIDNFAFLGSGLTSFTVPATVTSLGNGVFQNCASLISVSLPSGVAIGDNLFSGCTALTAIDIPQSVVKIGSGAFNNCKALTAIDLKTVTELGNNAFQNCIALASVTMNEGLVIIGSNAFKNCSALTTLTVPSTVMTINANAFEGCSSLMSLTFNGRVAVIKANVFKGWTVEQKIHMAVSAPLAGWDSNWNAGCGADIIWTV